MAYALGAARGGRGEDAAPPASRRRAHDGAPIEERLKEGRELLVQVVREGFGAKGPRHLLHHAPGPLSRSRSAGCRSAASRGASTTRASASGCARSSPRSRLRTADSSCARQGRAPTPRRFEPTPGSSSTPGRRSRGPPNGFPRRASCTPIWTCSSAPARRPRASFDRVIVDDEAMHRAGRTYLRELDPQLCARIARHVGDEPLFDATGVAQEIEKALKPRVWLSSGGHDRHRADGGPGHRSTSTPENSWRAPPEGRC